MAWRAFLEKNELEFVDAVLEVTFAPLVVVASFRFRRFVYEAYGLNG